MALERGACGCAVDKRSPALPLRAREGPAPTAGTEGETGAEVTLGLG